MLAEMEVRKLIEGGTDGAQGDASAAVPGRGKVTPTAAQQQDEGRGWSWGRYPEPVHPARCRAGEPQGDTGDTEAAAGMGSTPVMAAWHGTRSQLRRAQREKQRERAAREAVRVEQAARAAQAEKTRREAAARAEKAQEEAAQAEQAVREKEEKVRREALARAEKERVEAEQAAQAEREETRRGSVTDGAGVTGRHDPPNPRGMCVERRRVHAFPWQRERRARQAAARDTGMEAAHVESALAKQQVEMERGEASTPAAGPRTRPPPASPAALLEGLTGAPVGGRL